MHSLFYFWREVVIMAAPEEERPSMGGSEEQWDDRLRDLKRMARAFCDRKPVTRERYLQLTRISSLIVDAVRNAGVERREGGVIIELFERLWRLE